MGVTQTTDPLKDSFDVQTTRATRELEKRVQCNFPFQELYLNTKGLIIKIV